MGGVRQSVVAWLDGHVPRDLQDGHDPEELHRAKLAIRMGYFMAKVFFVLALVSIGSRYPAGALINGGLVVACVAGPLAMKHIGHYRIVLNLVLAASLVAMLALTIGTRGPGVHASTVALAEVPLFATLLGGVRLGAVWTGLSASAGVTVGLMGRAGMLAERVPTTGRLFHEHAALFVITITLFLVGFIYERRKKADVSQIQALEAERRGAELQRVRAEAEADVARAERLASVGRLAAAAAHEINNPLAIVSANLAVLERDLVRREDTDLVREAVAQVDRIAGIIDELQGAAAEPSDQDEDIELGGVVKAALSRTEARLRTCADVEVELDARLVACAQRERLVQAVVNLLVNAAESFESDREGSRYRLVVRVFASVAETPLRSEIVPRRGATRDGSSGESRPHGFGIIEVEDDGLGLAFGQVASVGLAVARDVISAAGGSLELTSRPGRTTTRAVLPLSIAPGETRFQRSTIPPEMAASVGELPPLSILVVDDEPALLRSLRRLLVGQAVTTAASGNDALDLIAEKSFDLVLCDLMMPDGSGMELYEALCSTDEELARHVVFMTGGTFTDASEAFRRTTDRTFLDKPIPVDALFEIIRSRQAELSRELSRPRLRGSAR